MVNFKTAVSLTAWLYNLGAGLFLHGSSCYFFSSIRRKILHGVAIMVFQGYDIKLTHRSLPGKNDRYRILNKVFPSYSVVYIHVIFTPYNLTRVYLLVGILLCTDRGHSNLPKIDMR